MNTYLKSLENDVDLTNKHNFLVINNRLKKFFNINNYEYNLEKEALKKDLNKMYLAVNNSDDNKVENENEFGEYNFELRAKKKDGLLFMKNFFGKMKNMKSQKKVKKKKNSTKFYEK